MLDARDLTEEIDRRVFGGKLGPIRTAQIIAVLEEAIDDDKWENIVTPADFD